MSLSNSSMGLGVPKEVVLGSGSWKNRTPCTGELADLKNEQPDR